MYAQVFMMNEFIIKPIGVVHNKFNKSNKPDDWSRVISEIKVYSRYKKALEGITSFKHILILFWFHEANISKLKVHPRGDRTKPERGVFATRSQLRPNKLGVTEVELLKVSGTTITVKGLDAFDGTPVIDIKSIDSK
jgi:tRNA-Thr(GGU) m(6)t(6)A37 methyltransferase TsaA